MTRRRELLLANLAGLLVLLVALLMGWWEAAAFGLIVLMFLDLMVILRGRQPGSDENRHQTDDSFGTSEDEEHG
jgi:hypothetical protein